MDANTAAVLRCLRQYAPCTKLCVKQHSGLAMSTVLRAVDVLAAEGWIEVSHHPVPQGGKPHTRLALSSRCVWGAAPDGDRWQVCRLSLTGHAALQQAPFVPTVSPVCLVRPDALPYGQGVACHLALTGGGAYVDDQLHLHLAGRSAIALGDLPSPILREHRLAYAEAYACCNRIQKNRLTAELAQWIQTLTGQGRVWFGDQSTLCAAEAGAWAALYRLLYL